MGDAPKETPSRRQEDASGTTMNVPAKPSARDRDSMEKTRDRDTPNENQTRVLCFGEALWDLQTKESQTFATADHLSMKPGGGAINVAEHLQSLGIRSAIAGAVGKDALGKALKARLAAMQIDVANLVEEQPKTGIVFLSSSPFAAVAYRSIVDEARAWAAALPERFDATIFHVSGLLPSPKLTTALSRAMARARKQGLFVTLDVNVRPKLWTAEAQARVDLRRVFRQADLVKVSEDDLRVLGYAHKKALASVLRAESIVVATEGARGATALGPFGEIHAQTEPLTLKSALGAGDAFVAGLLATLAKQHNARSVEAMRDALANGNAYAHRWLKQRD